jgi:hypothetical protein
MSEVSEKKGGGCLKGLGIGCAVIIVIAVIGAIIAYVGIKKFVSSITDTAPKALPVVTVSQAQADAVIARLDVFTAAIKKGEPTQALTLTANDINILIQKDPRWKEWSGKVFVTIQGDQLRGEVSMPLDALGSMTKGRYLNGAASFTVGLVSGQLILNITSVEVRGKLLPDQFMTQLRTKNLAEKLNQDANAQATLQRLESISVKNGAIQIVPKSAG